jgi:cobalt/nickel transport system permease protein
MAHIHLEDGTIPLSWAVAWALIATLIIVLCLYWLRNVRRADSRLIVLASMLTAATFAVFQFEIPPLGVHLSLTPFIGILAGPAMGGIIVLIINIFSAGIGHEGWTIIAPNYLINLTEVIGGWLVYRWLSRYTRMDVHYTAGIATFIGLLLGNVAMIAVIMISGIQGAEFQLSALSLIAAANMAMAIVESFVTAYIVAYIKKVRPDMLGPGHLVRATKP